jgi:hypothetical protein
MLIGSRITNQMDYASNWHIAGLQYDVEAVDEHPEIIMRGADVEEFAIRSREVSKLMFVPKRPAALGNAQAALREAYCAGTVFR